MLRDVDRLVDELPARGRAVRLSADEVGCGRVGGDGRDGHDEVAERVVGLQPSARADAEEAFHAELDQLLEDDRRARAAHAGSLDGYGLAVPGARVAEEPALAVHLPRVLEERLGDVLRAERIAREQARVRVVARLGSKMDRHRAETLRVRAGVTARNPFTVRALARTLLEPTREQILRFCAQDPVERVFLEDVARRGLGRFVALGEADGELRGAVPPRGQRRPVRGRLRSFRARGGASRRRAC